ncbi:tetratricopeptide repeat protein [Wohlfahrtiimonas larvae]|uniref:Tetratricopeptide repeat protein n=1 Tax=Wohlfahrtiimonas larvae TaxID=1157986 RepID=A0ABP9MQ73_9GAMM|nr:tetratricopeptide repeat protein [Wohlfahrtiimonas larvae]
MIKKMTLSLVMGLSVMLGMTHAQAPEKNSDMLNFLLGELAVQRNDLEAAAGYLEKITNNQKIPYVLRQQFNLAYGQADYVKALSFLEQILEGEPNNIEVLLFESIIYARLNSYDKAADVMNKIAGLYQKEANDNGFHFLYRELKGQIDRKAFLDIYQKIAKINNYSAEVTPLLASLLVDNGYYGDAIHYLNDVILKDQNNAVNYSLLMYAYSLLNEPEKGLAILKSAAEKSAIAEVKVEYLQALITEFYFEDALTYANQLLQEYPNDSHIYGHLALLNFALGNNDLAKEYVEKVIQLKGHYVNVIFGLADFARTTGRFSDLYEILPNINVIDVQVVRLIAEADMALRKKSYATFLAIFDELRTKFPDRTEYLYNQQLDMLEKSYDYQLLLPYAEILDVVTNYELFVYTYYKSLAYQEMKQYDKMQELMLSWIQRNPEDALALNGYGYVMLELAKTPQDHQYAMTYLKKAIALAPDEPAIMDSIGWGYFQEKNYVEARKYLWPAFNRLKQPDVIAHYIALLIEEQKLKEAKSLFDRLKIVYPDHIETTKLMKRYQGILK